MKQLTGTSTISTASTIHATLMSIPTSIECMIVQVNQGVTLRDKDTKIERMSQPLVSPVKTRRMIFLIKTSPKKRSNM